MLHETLGAAPSGGNDGLDEPSLPPVGPPLSTMPSSGRGGAFDTPSSFKTALRPSAKWLVCFTTVPMMMNRALMNSTTRLASDKLAFEGSCTAPMKVNKYASETAVLTTLSWKFLNRLFDGNKRRNIADSVNDNISRSTT